MHSSYRAEMYNCLRQAFFLACAVYSVMDATRTLISGSLDFLSRGSISSGVPPRLTTIPRAGGGPVGIQPLLFPVFDSFIPCLEPSGALGMCACARLFRKV